MKKLKVNGSKRYINLLNYHFLILINVNSTLCRLAVKAGAVEREPVVLQGVIVRRQGVYACCLVGKNHIKDRLSPVACVEWEESLACRNIDACVSVETEACRCIAQSVDCIGIVGRHHIVEG